MFNNAFALLHCDPLIRFNIANGFYVTLRPANCQIALRSAAEAEMHPKVTLGNVVSPAPNLIDLPATGRGQRQSCPDCVSSDAVSAPTSKELP